MSRVLLKNDVTLCRDDGSKVTFHIEKKMGSGASCVVYHAICNDNTEHLLKEYYPRNLELERSEDGTIVVPSHKQENFNAGLLRFREGTERQKKIRLLDDAKNSTSNIQGYLYGNGTEYIDMTVFSGCTYDEFHDETLYDMMRRMRALTQIVGYYHDAGMLHLDIKPQNIYAIPETPEMVVMFDFDSVTEKKNILSAPSLSYTKDWAAPEQFLPYKRNSLCDATDLFSIGEIIFTKIFGRHSTQAERRSFADYDIDYKADIFKNANSKVVPLIKELFRHTLCAVPSKRYQSAKELVNCLDKIIEFSLPNPYYLGKIIPSVQAGFVGRKEEIKEIHRLLKDHNVLFLSGIGGIGKTELVKKYANEYKECYNSITTLSFINDVTSMILGAEDFPYNLNMSLNEKLDEFLQRKMTELKKICDEKTLLIVDNLDSENAPDINLLFELGCKIIVTTRGDFSQYNSAQLIIDKLQKKEELREIFDKYYQVSDDEESKCVDEIIDLVEGHTMTVELIAKQIEAEWATADEILQRLNSSGISGIGISKVDIGKDNRFKSQSAYDHIKALFDLSVFEKTNNENALYVLANLSLIPHTGIERKLFAKWCELNKHGGNDCIKNLIKSGWVKNVGKCILLHPVVSEVVMESLDCSFVNQMLRNYKMELIFWQSSNDERKLLLKKCAYRISHVLQGKKYKTEIIVDLLDDLAQFFFQKAYDVKAAKNAILSARTKADEIIDFDKAKRLHIEGDYGVICDQLGEITQDKREHANAIKIYNDILSNKNISLMDDDFIAIIEQNIACAYDNLGDYERAILHYKKSVDIRINQPPTESNDLELAKTLNNIGIMYRKKDEYDNALEFYEKSFAVAKKYGLQTERVAKLYHDTARVMLMKEDCDFSKLRFLAEESLSIREKLWDENSYYIAMSKYVLAQVLIKIGTFESLSKAKTLLIVIKPVYTQIFGKHNRVVVELGELLDSL